MSSGFVLHLVATLARFRVVRLGCTNSTWLPLFLPTRKSVPVLGLKLSAAEGTGEGWRMCLKSCRKGKSNLLF